MDEEERVIKKAAKKGLKVIFTDELVDGIADGGFDVDSGDTVYISRYSEDPIKVVIKHEIVHSAELSKHYKKFSDFIFNKSKKFQKWVLTQINPVTGMNYKSVKEMLSVEYAVRRAVAKDETENSYDMAKREVVAMFISQTCFADSTGVNGEIGADFLKELDRENHNLFEQFVDWIKSIIARFKERDIDKKEIIKLEQKFLRLLDTVDRGVNENSNANGKEYSVFKKLDRYTEKQYNDFGWVLSRKYKT